MNESNKYEDAVIARKKDLEKLAAEKALFDAIEDMDRFGTVAAGGYCPALTSRIQAVIARKKDLEKLNV